MWKRSGASYVRRVWGKLCENGLGQAMWKRSGASYVRTIWGKLCENGLEQAVWERSGANYVRTIWGKLCENDLGQAMWERSGASYVRAIWGKLCEKGLVRAKCKHEWINKALRTYDKTVLSKIYNLVSKTQTFHEPFYGTLYGSKKVWAIKNSIFQNNFF